MPIYVYHCPISKLEDEKQEGHDFELLLPVSECDTPQVCPRHGGVCEKIPYPGCSWVWGYEDIAWDAGLSSNPMGLARAKTDAPEFKRRAQERKQ